MISDWGLSEFAGGKGEAVAVVVSCYWTSSLGLVNRTCCHHHFVTLTRRCTAIML